MNHYVISALFTIIINMFLAIFIFFKGPRKNENIIYSLFTISTALWSFGFYKMITSSNSADGLFWARTLHLGAIFIPVLFYHFAVVFLGLIEKRKHILVFCYVISILLLSITPTNLFVSSAHSKTSFKYFVGPGPLYHVFSAFFFLCVIYTLYTLYSSFRTSQDLRRTQIKYFFIAYLIGYSGGGMSFLPLFGIPMPSFALYTISICLIIVAYAVIKYRLMDIDLVWRYALSYITYLFMVVSIFMISLHFVQQIFLLKALVVSICVIIAIILYHIFVNDIQTRILTGGKNKYLIEMDNIIRDDTLILTTNDITGKLLRRLKDIMSLNTICLYLLKEDLEQFNLHIKINGDENSIREEDKYINSKNSIIEIVSKELEPIFKEEVEINRTYYKRAEILEFMNDKDAVLIMPIFLDEILQGLLLLGTKKDNSVFNNEDIKRLDSIVRILKINIGVRLMHRKGLLKSKSVYQGHLLEMAKRMMDITDLDKLVDYVIHAISRSVDALHAVIFLYDETENAYVYKAKVGKLEHKLEIINKDEYLIKYLRQREEPVYYNDLLRWSVESKSHDMKEAESLANQLNANALLPMVSDKLLGFIVIGDKRHGEYNDQDYNTFKITAHYAMLSIQKLMYSEETTTDILTGLYNRKMLNLKVEETINNVINTKRKHERMVFTFLMIDIDKFKDVNDTYGHEVGDFVLQSVSGVIKRTIRPIDMCFRIGGEELGILAMDAEEEGGYILAERTRKNIEDSPEIKAIKEKYGIDRPITISIGAAEFIPPEVDSMTYNLKALRRELIDRSDKAMYRAKNTGRNKVCLSSELEKNNKHKRIGDNQKEPAKTSSSKVTMFFSDMQGSTNIAGGREREDLEDIAREYLNNMDIIMEEWDGELEKRMGDGLFITHGYKKEIEVKDGAYKSVRMAIEMQNKVSEIEEQLHNKGIDTKLIIRIGIHTGRISEIKVSGQSELVGMDINIAAKIEQAHCKPAKITIEHSTYALIKDKIKATYIGEVEIEGLSRKIKIYEVDPSSWQK